MVILGLAACSGSAPAPRPVHVVPPCAALDEARRLYAAGWLERALRVLDDPARCATPPADLRGAIARELARTGDPDALIADALAARGRGDEVTARRLLDRALAAAEAGGARAQLAASLPSSFVRTWSSDAAFSPAGRHVLVPGWPGESTASEPHGMTVLDLETLRAIRVDGVLRPTFSPDGKHIVLNEGMDFWVIEVATGREVVSRRASSLFWTYFAPDGRLMWTDRDDREHRLHFLTIGGTETVLTAPAPPRITPDPRRPDRDEELDRVVFAPGGLVIATSTNRRPTVSGDRGELFVWRGERLVRHVQNVVVDPPPALDAHRLVFTLPADAGERKLVFLDLDHPERAVVELASRGRCGNALIDDYGPLHCSPGVWATKYRQHVCTWDLVRKRQLATIAIRDEVAESCSKTGVHVGSPAPGAIMDVYSTTTGKRTGTVEITLDEQPDAIARGELTLEGGADATDFAFSRDDRLVAGTLPGDRAAVWDARTGKRRWTSAPPPTAHAVVFDGTTGELVVAARDGAIWRFDLDAGRLRASPAIPECAYDARYSDSGVLALTDGRDRTAFVACIHHGAAMLYTEGSPAAVMAIPRTSPRPGLFSLAGGSLAYIDNHADVHVLPKLDPKRAWSVPVPKPGVFAIGVSPSGERLAMGEGGNEVALHARGGEMWRTKAEAREPIVVGSREQVATSACSYCGHHVWGTAGTKLAELTTRGVVAFDARGERVAYGRYWGKDYKLAIRDLATGAEVTQPAPGTGFYRSLAWSRDGKRIAAVHDRVVLIFDTEKLGPPSVLYLAGTAAVLARPDSTATLFGDAEAARALVDCRVGARLYPYALCQNRFEASAR